MLRVLGSLLLVLGTSLAGCVGEGTLYPEPRRLADLARCDHRYDNGSRIDCEADEGAAAAARAPSDWTCTHVVSASDPKLRVFSGLGWRVGLEYALEGWGGPGEAVVTGWVSVETDDDKQSRMFTGTRSGFVQLAHPATDEFGNVAVLLRVFRTNGTHGFFATENLEIRMTMHGERPWHLAVFPTDNRSYYVNLGAQPLDQTLGGEDYEVTIDTSGRDHIATGARLRPQPSGPFDPLFPPQDPCA